MEMQMRSGRTERVELRGGQREMRREVTLPTDLQDTCYLIVFILFFCLCVMQVIESGVIVWVDIKACWFVQRVGGRN